MLKMRPHSGGAGTIAKVSCTGFAPGEHVRVTFKDSDGTLTAHPPVTADGTGTFKTTVTVPAGAASGKATIAAIGGTSALAARKAFTVTSPT
jgi:hypothetical protein